MTNIPEEKNRRLGRLRAIKRNILDLEEQMQCSYLGDTSLPELGKYHELWIYRVESGHVTIETVEELFEWLLKEAQERYGSFINPFNQVDVFEQPPSLSES